MVWTSQKKAWFGLFGVLAIMFITFCLVSLSGDFGVAIFVSLSILFFPLILLSIILLEDFPIWQHPFVVPVMVFFLAYKFLQTLAGKKAKSPAKN